MNLAAFTQVNTWLLEYVYESVWTFYGTSNDVPLALRFLVDGCLQFESENLLRSECPKVQKMLCVLKCLLLTINADDADDADDSNDPDSHSNLEELLDKFSLLSRVDEDIRGSIAHHAIASYVADRRFDKAETCLSKYSAYLPSHLFSELRALINEEGKLENPPVITHLQNRMVQHLRDHYAPSLIFGNASEVSDNDNDNDTNNGKDKTNNDQDETANKKEGVGKSFLLKTAETFVTDNPTKESSENTGASGLSTASALSAPSAPAMEFNGGKEGKGKLERDSKRKGKRKSTEEEEEEEEVEKEISGQETGSGPTKAKISKNREKREGQNEDIREGQDFLDDSNTKRVGDAERGGEGGGKGSEVAPDVEGDEAALGSRARVRSKRNGRGRTEVSRVDEGSRDTANLNDSESHETFNLNDSEINNASALITVDGVYSLDPTTQQKLSVRFKDVTPPRTSTPEFSQSEQTNEQTPVTSSLRDLARPPLRSQTTIPPLPTSANDAYDAEENTQATNDLPFFQASFMKSVLNNIGFTSESTTAAASISSTTTTTKKAVFETEASDSNLPTKSCGGPKANDSGDSGSNANDFTRKLIEQSERKSTEDAKSTDKVNDHADDAADERTDKAADEVKDDAAVEIRKDSEDKASSKSPKSGQRQKGKTLGESSVQSLEESSQVDSPIFRNDKFIRKNRGKKSKEKDAGVIEDAEVDGSRKTVEVVCFDDATNPGLMSKTKTSDKNATKSNKGKDEDGGNQKSEDEEEEEVVRRRRKSARLTVDESDNEDRSIMRNKEASRRSEEQKRGVASKSGERSNARKQDDDIVVDEEIDDDDDDDDDNNDAAPKAHDAKIPAKKEAKKARASLLHPLPPQSGAEAGKRHQWTQQESVNIWKGVQEYGEGNWSKIMESYKFHSSRTNVSVKDRWRTMVKSGLDRNIARDMKDQ